MDWEKDIDTDKVYYVFDESNQKNVPFNKWLNGKHISVIIEKRIPGIVGAFRLYSVPRIFISNDDGKLIFDEYSDDVTYLNNRIKECFRHNAKIFIDDNHAVILPEFDFSHI